jgi:hypothetical protein
MVVVLLSKGSGLLKGLWKEVEEVCKAFLVKGQLRGQLP